MKPPKKQKPPPTRGAASRLSPKRSIAPGSLDERWIVFGVCVFLAAIVWIVFGQARQFDFVNLDDGLYVYDNHTVSHGLTRNGVAWAFSERGMDNWIPATTLSHMLDCQVYGLNAGGHHVTNIALHMATVILLFLALRKMTGALWRSAIVAAVFAIHPLRTESVAWISERKDVLSGVFFMLTLWAYAGYVRAKSPAHYAAALLYAALGLMSKPMLVTLPFILLLLDYWPLGRMNPATLRKVLVEKIPFAALSLASCVVTVLVQQKIGAVKTLANVPMPMRIENTFVSYARYLGKTFWPDNLAVFYPLPAHWPGLLVAGAAALVIALCVMAMAWRKKFPFVFTGWFWFVGMLVPVIGLVQVGEQALADRYTYLPQIGLCIAITWLIAEMSARWRHRIFALGTLSAIVLVALMFCTNAQMSYWANGEALWTHTLACTPDNSKAHRDFGDALFQKGRLDDAIGQFQHSLKLDPKNVVAHNDLGNALLQKGDIDGAMTEFQEAIKNDAGYAVAYYNLGDALMAKGQLDDAINQYRQAVKLDPGSGAARDDLGNALMQKGQLDEAAAELQEALKIDPEDGGAHSNLGNVLFRKRQLDDAIGQYRDAVQADPGGANFHNNLATALLAKGETDEAVTQYQAALKLKPDNIAFQDHLARAIWMLAATTNGAQAIATAQSASDSAGGNNPMLLRALAAAEGQAGNFSGAIETAQRALALATQQEDPALGNALQQEIALYQAGSTVNKAGPTSMTGWQ